ncbi:methyltransferase domain-containing protein [Simiduia sp. 21SJ11W-1]|uniref:methyltransferase domain-containing protein n=1 Tax=Simiduia sp. 21SJ11W-1 TaxID=2909669 RepID=UPI00209CCC98|nr:methyltransferase domain-containing protein [Simiduia sp. 21SJ11W-1]UTA46661.1 methyltransferase domain-containing protein [Simiduia sp. 21SJ11W-1]
MREDVKTYYGETLQKSEDLQTNACCTGEMPPEYLKPILAAIHPEVHARYYGCGLIVPEHINGTTVLDLGSGAGLDCYALSALVGEQGRVIGVDMTEQQLAVARAHIDYHREKFGFKKANVSFLQGELEHLDKLDIPDNSIDVIVSNCVINLCEDKARVLQQAYRLLKPGGEMYFSDVYADRRIPTALAKDPVLYGECLSGAFYWNDFHNTAKACGFLDPRLVKDAPITIENPALKNKCGNIRFFSATYRLFKLPELEPFCEDYGQAVIYKGTIAEQPHSFSLDKHHHLPTGKVFPVCGNTWRMLADTRFKPHFEFIGNWDTHYGIFDGCGTALPYDTQTAGGEAGACC